MGFSGGNKLRRYDTAKWLMPKDGPIDVGDSMDEPVGFFQGGKDIRGRDWLAAGLGAVADTFDPSGKGGALDSLMGGRKAALGDARKVAEQQQQLQQLIAAGVPADKARLVVGGVGGAKYSDVAPKAPEDDVFTRALRAGGIDPDSPQGQEMYRQRATTMASPAPNFVGDGMGGGRWVQPPPPQVPGDVTRPVGRITPMTGGGVGNGAGGFPRRYR